MSDFAVLRQSLVPVLLAYAGESISYFAPKSSTATLLLATLGPVVKDNTQTITGRAADCTREIKVLGVAGQGDTDLPAGLDAAGWNGRFEIEGESWGLSRIIASTSACHHLELKRLAPREDIGRQTITPYRMGR